MSLLVWIGSSGKVKDDNRKKKQVSIETLKWTNHALIHPNYKNDRNDGKGQSSIILYNFEVISIFEVVFIFEIAFIFERLSSQVFFIFEVVIFEVVFIFEIVFIFEVVFFLKIVFIFQIVFLI